MKKIQRDKKGDAISWWHRYLSFTGELDNGEKNPFFLSSLCVYFYLSLSICTISWFRVVTILQNLHGICIVIIIMILSSHPPLLFVLFVSLLSWVMIHHPPLLRLHIIIINMPFANISLYAYKKPYHLAFQSIPSFLHREKYPHAWYTIALNGKNQQRKEEFKWMHEYMHEYVHTSAFTSDTTSIQHKNFHLRLPFLFPLLVPIFLFFLLSASPFFQISQKVKWIGIPCEFSLFWWCVHASWTNQQTQQTKTFICELSSASFLVNVLYFEST